MWSCLTPELKAGPNAHSQGKIPHLPSPVTPNMSYIKLTEFVKNAGHCDRAMKEQTLPEALEYVWQD